MPRFRVSIIQAPIVKNIGNDLTITKTHIRFRVGYKNGTKHDEYYSEFAEPLTDQQLDVFRSGSKVSDLIDLFTKSKFKEPAEGEKYPIPSEISVFQYVTTSDDKYAFTVHNPPVIHIVSACVQTLSALPRSDKVVGLLRSILDMVPDLKNPPKASTRENIVLFKMLKTIRVLSEKSLEIGSIEEDRKLDPGFDFRDNLGKR